MGTSVPEIDSVLAPYVEKSYNKYLKDYKKIVYEVGGVYDENKANKYADEKTRREIQQGIQGLEYSLNTISSSRGDHSFTSVSFGIDTSRWARMTVEEILKVRKEGQGKEGHKQTVLFPKLIFLYDSRLHGPGKELEYLFLQSVETSIRRSYPDYLSLEPGTVLGNFYHETGRAISPMGKIIMLTKKKNSPIT